MRLVCPNCDAEYEIERYMIPDTGREVQCSNCRISWFHVPETTDIDSDDEDGSVPFVTSRPNKPEIDPAAMAIIQEEVALERETRGEEKNTQPSVKPDKKTKDPETQNRKHDDFSAPKREDPALKSERLPDIEEINSSLSPEAAEAAAAQAAADMAENNKRPSNPRSGFRLGFGLMLLIALGLFSTYIYAPEISEKVPALETALNNYVSAVDNIRYSLDDAAQHAIKQIAAIMGEAEQRSN